MTQAQPGPSSIAVYVCTHRRNGPLQQMLESLDAAAQRVQPSVEIAVVVVDDNPDGRALGVVEGFDDRFARGLHYRYSGTQNISLARNTGVEAALELADWVAMTDDDQVVTEGWFEAMVDVQRRTGADAVTGPVKVRYPEGSASWMTDQPFIEILEATPVDDGAKVGTCSTGNSMIRGSFLTEHNEIRFRPDLGKTGGEDMVFYKAAVAAGLDSRYSKGALCYTDLPPERLTYRYHLRACYWIGNTEFLTNFESGDSSRLRLTARGTRRFVEAIVRPFRRVATGRDPHWRFAGGALARSLGTLVGVVGIRVDHQ
ncbi:MAG: glycosyltransferase [Actinomycetia bacterium]|nr:glycosyltransferase [Actinomycetes bacterium]MCP4226639.1 glycosyltransferase [Actinomycetes bacterium]MCP5033886.1 glycosyltransferase [Actinomycetes bacterium]